MTRQTTLTYKRHTAAAGVTTYAYPFKITAAGQIRVRRLNADLIPEHTYILNSDYTLTGVGGASGGNVVFAVAPAASTELLFDYVDAATQDATYPSKGNFNGPAHEAVLDRVVGLLQVALSESARSFKLAHDETLQFPPLIQGVGKFWTLVIDDVTGKPKVVFSPSVAAVEGVFAIADEVVVVAGIANSIFTLAQPANTNALAALAPVADELGALGQGGIPAAIAALGNSPLPDNLNALGPIAGNITTVAGSIDAVNTIAVQLANANSPLRLVADDLAQGPGSAIEGAIASAASAAADALTAERFAIHPEDTSIPGEPAGTFSALHSRLKAAASAQDAADDAIFTAAIRDAVDEIYLGEYANVDAAVADNPQAVPYESFYFDTTLNRRRLVVRLSPPLSAPIAVDFATEPEVLAGVVADKAVSPLTLLSVRGASSLLATSALTPTTRLDGSALQAGDMFFSTAAGDEGLKQILDGGFGKVSLSVSARSWGAKGDVAATLAAFDALVAGGESGLNAAVAAATDDTVKLQQAINKASLAGVSLDLEGRAYKITANLALDAGGTSVRIFNGVIIDANPTRSDQRVLTSDAAGMRIDLDGVYIHRGTNRDAHVPANITTTAPDTISNAGIRLTNAAYVRIVACRVTGHGVGSGIIVNGVNSGVIVYNRVFDMEWNAEAATTPADVTYLNIDDGINGVALLNTSGLLIQNNVVERLSTRWDDGTGVKSFYCRTRGMVESGGNGAGNRRNTWLGNTVSLVDQGFDFTGGSATSGNSFGLVAFNTAIDCYSFGFKLANTARFFDVRSNKAINCGFMGFVCSAANGTEIPTVLQSQENIFADNWSINTAVYNNITVRPADHNSGNGFVGGGNHNCAFGLLEGTGNGVSYPWGCVFRNNHVIDDNNVLTSIYYSTVTPNASIQLAPNVHFGTTVRGATHLSSALSLSTGAWNPKVQAFIAGTSNPTTPNGSTFVALPYTHARMNDHAMWAVGTPSEIVCPWPGRVRVRSFSVFGPSTAASASVRQILQANRDGTWRSVSTFIDSQGRMTNDGVFGAAEVSTDTTLRISANTKFRVVVATNDSANLAVRASGVAATYAEFAAFLLVEYLPDVAGGADLPEALE